MIELNGLSKVFQDRKKGQVVAADGVSFTVKAGEIFGLLGVNGAGKTTTLRMLSTVIKPSSGSATVCGYDIVKQAADVRASIGFLSTSTALYMRATPIEVLRYFGSLYGMPSAKLDERVDYVVDRLKIGDFADRQCDKLSTGQKQRVSIGRTILHDPPVLFFDEPTAGLDVVTSQTVLEFIEETRVAGKAVVFSTHIMTEAERLCDRVSIIHNGKICAENSVHGLIEQTGAKSFEQAFLSSIGYTREEAML
ncbi:MAG: ATP-binding cassette domain-containing protein [Armatimonadetes bacterium]|nr:ATP-binding cassette domain-containing protein [Armatimonadota bacterium]